jgi:tetratricopeptide (TPR) repeat protein
MRIDLTRRWSQVLFCAVVLALASILAFFGGKVWLAEHWNASSRPGLWAKAAELEPGNAQYWSHLGSYKQWALDHGNVQEAVRDLERATRTDPRSADLWMRLADAYEAEGKPNRAQAAYAKAQADYPMSAEVAWRYGSFFLYEGKFAPGYAEIKRALLVEPALATSAVAECWQANPHVDALLQQALPAQSAYYLPAIDYFLSRQLLDPALAVWNRQIALGLPVKMPQAIPLVNALIGQNRMDEAQRTWKQALRATNWPRNRDRGGSLIFNGGFEHTIVNGGFGWREYPGNDVRIATDSHVAHSGSRSLRIEFGGKTNLNFQNVFQLVPVQPRMHYHFSAYVRTKRISTGHGIRFEISDPRHPSAVQILTPNMTGTNPWTRVQADVTTGAKTDLLEIALRRLPTWKFDNKIRGTVWVDDVALVPAKSSARGSAK